MMNQDIMTVLGEYHDMTNPINPQQPPEWYRGAGYLTPLY
jgi:hypothetical protein